MSEPMDPKTRAYILRWLDLAGQDRERLARWLRDCWRVRTLRECRDMVAEAISAGKE